MGEEEAIAAVIIIDAIVHHVAEILIGELRPALFVVFRHEALEKLLSPLVALGIVNE